MTGCFLTGGKRKIDHLIKIVVVEDDASMSLAIERVLLAGGMSSELFHSAEELLAMERRVLPIAW